MAAAIASTLKPGVYEQFESTTATKLNNEGALLFQNGNFEGAISKYTLGISLTTENNELVALLSNRSFAYFNVHKFNESKEDAEKCLTYDPVYTKAFLLLGKALQASGNQVEACKTFYNAICEDDSHRDMLLQPLIDINNHCHHFHSDVIDALSKLDHQGSFCKICRQKDDLFRCMRCKLVHYCSKEHQKKDWKTHKLQCSQLAEANQDMLELSSLQLSCDSRQFTVTTPFKSLDGIEEWGKVWQHIELKSDEYKKVLSESLSWPLTLTASICKFKLEGLQKLQIHVLGAKDFYLDRGFFTYLLEMFPLPHTDVTLIGLELSKNKQCLQYKNATGRNISLSFVSDHYRNFTSQDGYLQPDLIVAYQPLLSCFISKWASALRYIIMNNIPCVVTSSSGEDFDKNMEVLKNEVYNTTILFDGKSPFSSYVKRLFRKTTDYSINYTNSYWVGFIGGKCLSEDQLKSETNKLMKELLGESSTGDLIE